MSVYLKNLQELVNPRYEGIINQSLAIMLTALVASFFPWQFVRMWGRFVLLLMAYGIGNDLIACRVCPQYFTVGHFYDGERLESRLLKTMDPTLTAVVWGIVVTATLGGLGSLVLSAKFTMSGLDEALVMKSAFMYLLTVLAVADIVSRLVKFSVDPSQLAYGGIPAELRGGWQSTNARNAIGYLGLIGGGLFALFI